MRTEPGTPIQTTQLLTLLLQRDGDRSLTVREGPHGFGRLGDGTVYEVHQVIGTSQPLDGGSA